MAVSGRKRTHYDNLQVSRNASPAVIQAAYRALALRYHPDKWPEGRGEGERIMRLLNEAYEVLSDPEKRKNHDRWIDEAFAADVKRSQSASSPPKSPREAKGSRRVKPNAHETKGPRRDKPDAGEAKGSRRNKPNARQAKGSRRNKPMWLGLAAVLLLIGPILLVGPILFVLSNGTQLNRVSHDSQPASAPPMGQLGQTPQVGLPAAATAAARPKTPDRVGQDGQPATQARPGQQPPAQQQLPAVTQRVVLYEEDPADPAGKRFTGSAIWRTETVTPGGGQAPDLVVRCDVEIPERRLALTMSIRRNRDRALPASHTVEIMFNLPAD